MILFLEGKNVVTGGGILQQYSYVMYGTSLLCALAAYVGEDIVAGVGRAMMVGYRVLTLDGTHRRHLAAA